jgi:hypothetical protein
MFSTPTSPQISQATTGLAAINSALAEWASIQNQYMTRDPYRINTLIPLATTYAALFEAVLSAELSAAAAAAESALAPFFASPSDIADITTRIDTLRKWRPWQNGFDIGTSSVVDILTAMQTLFTEVV